MNETIKLGLILFVITAVAASSRKFNMVTMKELQKLID